MFRPPVIVDDHDNLRSWRRLFAVVREFLSFLAMIDDLGIRAGLDGRVVRHRVGDIRPRAHRHAELEVNLVVRGTASYLLGDRRYALRSGTLTWLFPGQDHVLVDESADHELWWAVFRPASSFRSRRPGTTDAFLRRIPLGSSRAGSTPAWFVVWARSSTRCRMRRR